MADKLVIRINAEYTLSRHQAEALLARDFYGVGWEPGRSKAIPEDVWREMLAIASDEPFSLHGVVPAIVGSLHDDAETELAYQADAKRLAQFDAEHSRPSAQARAVAAWNQLVAGGWDASAFDWHEQQLHDAGEHVELRTFRLLRAEHGVTVPRLRASRAS